MSSNHSRFMTTKTQVPSNQTGRVDSIDVLRGLAIWAMVGYHFVFDLSFFSIVSFRYQAVWWDRLGEMIGGTFLFLVGVSLWLRWQKHAPEFTAFRTAVFSRAIEIGVWAGLITLGTWLIWPTYSVQFGILHLIAASLLILTPAVLLKPRYLAGITVFFIAWWIWNLTFIGSTYACTSCSETPLVVSWFLLALGLRFEGFRSFDYYPIIPWISVVTLGLFVAQSNLGRLTHLLDEFLRPVPRSFYSFLKKSGRASLLIYLIHQPIILGTGWLIQQLSQAW